MLFVYFAIMQITLKEYQENKDLNKDNLSMPAITKRLREGRPLPNVIKVHKLHRFYLLELISKKNKRVSG
jgi:hypothetical protein